MISEHRKIGGPSWHKCEQCDASYRKAGSHEWAFTKCHVCRGKEAADRTIHKLWRKAWRLFGGDSAG